MDDEPLAGSRVSAVGTGDTGDPDTPAGLAFAGACLLIGKQLAGGTEQTAGTRRGYTGQPEHLQCMAARHTAVEPFENTQTFCTGDQLVFDAVFIVTHVSSTFRKMIGLDYVR